MAIRVTAKPLLFTLAILCISLLGNAYEENSGLAGYDPFTGTSVVGNQPNFGTGVEGRVPQTGAGKFWDYPAQIISKALLCFSDKLIYSGCEESYRLTQTGNLNVPPGYVDEYCKGPCLTETHLVLNCLENVMEDFLFFNKATVHDIKDTIKTGCGYGPKRGNFDVLEHLQAVENGGYKTRMQIFLVLVAFGFLLVVLSF